MALVTGGNRGIGRATVEALAADGVDVVFTYRSHEDEAEQTVDAVAAVGRRATAIRLDAADTASHPSFTAALAEVLRAEWGRGTFDILVNNAGFSGDSPLGATEESVIDQLYQVHFKGVYLLTQALATASEGSEPLLADGGRIINFSSCLSRIVTAPFSVYSALKGAVEVLTRYWAVELGGRGITVNTIAPGPAATDFAGGYLRISEEYQKAMSDMSALGRVAAADDIGPAVTALVSAATQWITAQRIEVSGGIHL
ncbi:SDR family NAD(P)-dependent oxidoreductase [Streptomyces olivaceus]|uniref:SDR family NAD(P)-dependent oxidoreductase n=1 Tax=Streptomyces olivaceus TaxID=47716 RepID=UPI0004C9BE44|nr:SDR family oxidoreductase [Streptomyces olivaceus]MBZ6106260.1 SDR family oxidoreductase [Streptomyces olivaceus]MBZ6283026.1 SDR family oxidoreductase [Streptomyces olivaceus]